MHGTFLVHFCRIFRPPSTWALRPSGADARSHARCWATESGSLLRRGWTRHLRSAKHPPPHHHHTTTTTTPPPPHHHHHHTTPAHLHDAPTHRHTNARAHLRTETLTHQHASAPTHRHTDTPVCCLVLPGDDRESTCQCNRSSSPSDTQASPRSQPRQHLEAHGVQSRSAGPPCRRPGPPRSLVMLPSVSEKDRLTVAAAVVVVLVVCHLRVRRRIVGLVVGARVVLKCRICARSRTRWCARWRSCSRQELNGKESQVCHAVDEHLSG